MSTITEPLYAEHQHILRVTGLILKECKAIENGKQLDLYFFDMVIRFIRHYADGYHHAKEEKVLFEALQRNQHKMHCNPIPVMLQDHENGRCYTRAMEEALQEDNIGKLLDSARKYCFMLHQHIAKEDNVLFPMAEEVIDDYQKMAIEKAYRSIRFEEFFDTDIATFVENLKKISCNPHHDELFH